METHSVGRQFFMDLMKTKVQVIDKDGVVNGAADKTGYCYEGGLCLHRAIDDSEVIFEGLRDRFRSAALLPPENKGEYDKLFKEYEICLRLVKKVEEVAEIFKKNQPFYKDDPVDYPALIMSQRSIVQIEKQYREWAETARTTYFTGWKLGTSTCNRYLKLQEMCGKLVDK